MKNFLKSIKKGSMFLTLNLFAVFCSFLVINFISSTFFNEATLEKFNIFILFFGLVSGMVFYSWMADILRSFLKEKEEKEAVKKSQ